uniref:BHLH domain-containing protein n=1 Tax=Kalanchoe fedtschenkoi TaxID=63787 RepID=A0A7N0VBQ2_KALFE
MRSGVKNSNEEEDYGEEDQGGNQSKRDGKGSASKANATRSKHSVTEQRRRSKINERFQRLRDLIPNSDQKRDTASFLLEVIDYVQYLQGEMQKYEGPYQPWSAEPAKLMPWRNSHWRTQSIAPQPLGNGVGAGYAPKFNDTSQSTLLGHPHEFSEPDALADPTEMKEELLGVAFKRRFLCNSKTCVNQTGSELGLQARSCFC